MCVLYYECVHYTYCECVYCTMSVRICVYVCVTLCACMHVCPCVCMCVYVRACVCACCTMKVYILLHIHHYTLLILKLLCTYIHNVNIMSKHSSLLLALDISFPVFARFERGGQGHTGILTKPTPCGHVFSLVHIIHWFDLLLAPLDAYTWAFENNLLSPSDVFKGEGLLPGHTVC